MTIFTEELYKDIDRLELLSNEDKIKELSTLMKDELIFQNKIDKMFDESQIKYEHLMIRRIILINKSKRQTL